MLNDFSRVHLPKDLVASLQTSRQHVVFARLVTVVNKFGTSY